MGIIPILWMGSRDRKIKVTKNKFMCPAGHTKDLRSMKHSTALHMFHWLQLQLWIFSSLANWSPASEVEAPENEEYNQQLHVRSLVLVTCLVSHKNSVAGRVTESNSLEQPSIALTMRLSNLLHAVSCHIHYMPSYLCNKEDRGSYRTITSSIPRAGWKKTLLYHAMKGYIKMHRHKRHTLTFHKQSNIPKIWFCKLIQSSFKIHIFAPFSILRILF